MLAFIFILLKMISMGKDLPQACNELDSSPLKYRRKSNKVLENGQSGIILLIQTTAIPGELQWDGVQFPDCCTYICTSHVPGAVVGPDCFGGQSPGGCCKATFLSIAGFSVRLIPILTLHW